MAILNRAGLYYKQITIVNDDSNIINKLETSLTDDARVIIYNCHMFIVQATGWPFKTTFKIKIYDGGGGGALTLTILLKKS
jgi:hypothetical protein